MDGGIGEDYFQIGQMFGLDRVNPNVAVGDEITTVETTVGFLSCGISFPTTIYGGDDGDNFVVYSNKALLKLFGEDGNDEFIIRAFVIKNTDDLASTDTEVSGGAGDDHIQYNINAPVSIDGGAGADTVVVLGTEIDDNFVITEYGVQGAGLNVDFTAVEKELSLAQRIMVEAVARVIGTDVHADDEDLVPLGRRIGLGQARLALPQRLHLGAG